MAWESRTGGASPPLATVHRANPRSGLRVEVEASAAYPDSARHYERCIASVLEDMARRRLPPSGHRLFWLDARDPGPQD
jgi:hypothetical protein